MKKDCSENVLVCKFDISGICVVHLFLFYYVARVAVIPLILFNKLFPLIKNPDQIIMVPEILVIVGFLLYIASWFCTVVFCPEKIAIRWCGITFRTIPVSELRLFCTVGNGRQDVLCMSCLSIEEMAQIQEKRLQKSFLNKHDVPRRKRRLDWQCAFTRDYLNHVFHTPFGFLTNREAVMIEMNPETQYLLRRMYPQLPYRNLTGITSLYTSPISHRAIKVNQAVRFPLENYNYAVELKAEGIHILNVAEEICFISAQRIKMVVRVDVFRSYEKFYPHHLPVMLISCWDEKELADQVSTKAYGKMSNEYVNQSLLAMIAATDKAMRWKEKQTDCCVLHYTEKNVQTIRRLYPDVVINDIAGNWMYDAETDTTVE